MGVLDGILSSVLGNLGNAGGLRDAGSVRQWGSGRDGGSDNPFGSVLGGIGGIGGNVAMTALVALAFRVLQQNGGISGLLDKMRGSGLGQQASSWVSTGSNLPIDVNDLQRVLGSGDLADLASRFGLTPDQASEGLAQVLPDVVDRMTPTGDLPDNDNDLISEALAQLRPRT